jgi:hypothetical protein
MLFKDIVHLTLTSIIILKFHNLSINIFFNFFIMIYTIIFNILKEEKYKLIESLIYDSAAYIIKIFIIYKVHNVRKYSILFLFSFNL